MMKQIVILIIMFTMLLSACKKKNTRPSEIYVTSTVTDKETSNPIDSVEVNLRKNDGFGSWIYIHTYYTDKSGIVNFSFKQDDNWVYDMKFNNKNYESYKASLDKEKKNQDFKIQLIKKEK